MSTDSRQAILDTIDKNRDKAIKFLQKMVSIPSVTGDEAAIQAFLADYMNGIGLDVDMWETNWEELKKHPGYIPVDRGYEGRPNIVAHVEGHRRRPLAAVQRPHRRDPGRQRRRLERQSLVGQDRRTAASMAAAPAT